MSYIEYDLDSSGGLMSQIQALIAPPMSEDTKSKNVKKEKEGKKHAYFKRPGRGHNRDLCDACQDGGKLICCDKCPASFHLLCHDPPLNPTNIPNGEWMCHACKSAAKNDANLGKKKKKKTALEVLAFAASLLNPREFELPKELQLPITFPGSDKISINSKKSKQSASNNNEKSHCLDSNLLVPLPARLCFECGRSCRKAPLVSCDYCPLYFHMDCLDPPLTAFPSGRWMCPNHVNHFLDQHLLKSCRATERVQLWDKYAQGKVDQHTVKLDFLRKVRRVHPMFRMKTKITTKPRVVVPAAIKYHYEHPPLIDAPQFFRSNYIIRPVFKNQNNEKSNDVEMIEVPSFEKSEESLQMVSKSEKDEQNDIDCQSEGETKGNDSRGKVQNCKNDNVTENDDKKGSAIENLDEGANENINKSTKAKEDSRKGYENTKEDGKSEGKCQTVNLFDEELYKSMGYSIKEGVQLLERPVLEALALQRLDQILNSQDPIYETIDRNFRARAALFPIGQRAGPPAFMNYKTFTIGIGSNCDLPLSRYGHCDLLSSKHAVIFYDETTQKYELLNYGEHGTVVDDVLYSCNYVAKPVTVKKEKEKDSSKYRDQDPTNAIRDIISKSKTALQSNEESELCDSKGVTCKCARKMPHGVPSLQEGWESSAIVQHGSILSFGCLVFVFHTLGIYQMP